MNLLKIYEEFLELRERLIKEALEKSAFCEERESGNVRPFVVLENEEEYDYFMSLFGEWDNKMILLTQNDPVRFKETARIFNPPPMIIRDVHKVSIREMKSTSQQKIEKAKILKRMNNLLANEKESAEQTGDYAHYKAIKEEIRIMNLDDEEFYLRRAGGYPDIRALLYLDKDSVEPTKASVSYAGIFVLPHKDADRANFLSLPDQSRQEKVRNDSWEEKKMKPIKCSLGLKGKLYKHSEFEASKRKSKQV